jgi:alkanesulfonate monooxygenase SsuD/methylene tetrahydromethanopterin reductase-like flavin-dependent oxidoreductase (luciferase family)
MGQESAAIVASLGFGQLISTQKEWSKLEVEVARFHELAAIAGHTPKAPIVLAAISVANSREEASERAFKYLSLEWAMIDAHYRFSDGHMATLQGYESYANTQEYFKRIVDPCFRDQATTEYADLQLIGTPDDCVQRIEELGRLTRCEHLVLEFSYGGMPFAEGERNLKLFASDVMPALRSKRAEFVE